MTLVDQLKSASAQQRDERLFREARRRHVRGPNYPSWPFSQVATFPLGDQYRPHAWEHKGK
jgi:hypothetical protein